VGVDVLLHLFLTSVLDGGEWSVSQPGNFAPKKEPQYQSNRKLGWPPAGLDDLEKSFLPLLEFEPWIV
jgi:hypothetical protein